ncbi:TonB-dependent receptor [Flavobacterium sp. Fl-318]|uniref:TonB-dependent receptor n=1 Tax=Flavobacterium cupriresistens TaxID=2893885 RepID=A0ABU4RD95_9FLAO|nr:MULTISPECIES: TonB-dependent receptor [unclassified Flavobacterium]MDX6190551.1 TonB-dependent receptor [Flavobacterium sp. Fl-318]UFH43611.1 TonB-dependent receptor plug domain-containing protein [Flavobacterium sp. F-323]
MQFKRFFLTILFAVVYSTVYAQNDSNTSLTGYVLGDDSQPLVGAAIQLQKTATIVHSNHSGKFVFENMAPGKYGLIVSMNEYQSQEIAVVVKKNLKEKIVVTLSSNSVALNSVDLFTKTVETKVREQPFAVSVINTKKLAERDVDLNRLMDGTSGIRVQETGGMGSEFNYSINGLSGKAVKIFIDGIPMESFGSSFSINNFAINTIDRIEVYKGVTPVALGADALGGSINLVSRTRLKNYLDLSQTIGTFNTYRTALSGKWRAKSGFTVQTNSFYNYSDNNYQVWGPTVEVAEADGRVVPGYPRFRRFNDDYKSYTIKTDVGFTNVKWADVFLFGLTLSDQDRGIQTGRTMAYVYGDVRYKEKFVMPSVRYSKKGFLFSNLNVDLYASINKLRGTTTDTSSYKYNWRGEPTGTVANGELGGHKASKSIYSFQDNTRLARVNFAYQIKSNQQVNFNYVFSGISRKGSDAIATAEWTIPFRNPQDLNKHIAGLSYEITSFNDRWSNVFFAKYFAYNANTVDYDYKNGASQELIYLNTKDNVSTFGYASKLLLPNEYTVKVSVENAARLPEAAELLGNGNTILNAPDLQPERSFNANASLQKTIDSDTQHLNLGFNLFFRNTKNLIWLAEGDLFGTARYENLGKIQTLGVEFEANYARQQWFELAFNFTYQDIRNMQRFETNGARNYVYQDRLRNTPYLMGNAEVRLFLDHLFQMKHKISFFASTHYVHQYYLGWPSLGAPPDKLYVPTQFVQDAGLGYTFGEGRYSLNAVCRNLFDKQVYDNYLLQKPGRFFSLKLRYLLQ